MTNREFTQKIEERYLGQSISEFLANGGDAAEYARQVFAREVFGPGVDPRDEELDIMTESDLAQALEFAAREEQRNAQPHVLQVRTLDPHTTARVFDGHEEIDTLNFDFYSEDRREWERLADERLVEAGYRRVSEWRDTDFEPGAVADIVRA